MPHNEAELSGTCCRPGGPFDMLSIAATDSLACIKMDDNLTSLIPRLAALVLLSAVCTAAPRADTPIAPDARAMASTCATCHWNDDDGRGDDGGIPSLHRRSSAELLKKLREYRADAGDPTIMNRIAKGFTDEQLAQIAEYIAASAGASGTTP
jgi:cytochrome c553